MTKEVEIKAERTEVPHQVKVTNLKSVNLEVEKTEDGDMKVTEEFISELRALARLQKMQKSAEEFTKVLGNNGKDIPKPGPSEDQINKIIDGFEIEEE